MFLFNHALVVDMLVDAPETPSFAPIVGVRRSIFAKHITASIIAPLQRQRSFRFGEDGSTSFAMWKWRTAEKYVFPDVAVSRVIHGACQGGHRKLAEMMITNGADNLTCVFPAACYSGNRELVDLMIEEGETDWNVALCGACEGGYRELAKMMVERGADDWTRGLWSACKGGHHDLAELMIERGANGWNFALYAACEGGYRELAELMIEKGADKCRRCYWKKSSGIPHSLRAK